MTTVEETATGVLIRHLTAEDLFKPSFRATIGRLKPIGAVSDEDLACAFADIEANPLHSIWIAELNGEIVGSITLLVEPKFIHQCGRVGHIEDVVVRTGYAIYQIGTRLMRQALEQGRATGCYKIILDCEEHLRAYYGRFGFVTEEGVIHMRQDLIQ